MSADTVSASNHLPEEDALRALFDRFLLRCHVDDLPRASLPNLLTAGWALEQGGPPEASVSADDLRRLSRQLYEVDLAPVRELYGEVVVKVRDLGIAFSDRRAVKAQKLIAASALLCGRLTAAPSALWVLRYVWDRAEQIGPLRALVQGVLEQHSSEGEATHPLAAPAERVDGEDLARQLDEVARELESGGRPGKGLPLRTLARLRERVADLSDRAAWVADSAARNHLLRRSGELLERLG
jgi:MoxR-like ATPase